VGGIDVKPKVDIHEPPPPPPITGVVIIDQVLDDIAGMRGLAYDEATRYKIRALLQNLEQAIKYTWERERRFFRYTWTCSPIDASFHINMTEVIQK
jgi:hypothetical protein